MSTIPIPAIVLLASSMLDFLEFVVKIALVFVITAAVAMLAVGALLEFAIAIVHLLFA